MMRNVSFYLQLSLTSSSVTLLMYQSVPKGHVSELLPVRVVMRRNEYMVMNSCLS
jgi:hypothetical protein